MQSLDIQAFTYEQRNGLLPVLTAAFSNCGGWVLERKTLSPTNMEFRVEIQLRAILDLYAAIIATGVELTRSGHETLTELCTRRIHLQITAASICASPPNSARSSPSAWRSTSSTTSPCIRSCPAAPAWPRDAA